MDRRVPGDRKPTADLEECGVDGYSGGVLGQTRVVAAVGQGHVIHGQDARVRVEVNDA